jgi:hypothetical protein
MTSLDTSRLAGFDNIRTWEGYNLLRMDQDRMIEIGTEGSLMWVEIDSMHYEIYGKANGE